jgi:tripartite ATP-independent transporter DctP family solute receptor
MRKKIVKDGDPRFPVDVALTHNKCKQETFMKTFRFISCGVAALALAWLPLQSSAQTVLKFSHTDQPGGARQKAAELFAQKVGEYTQGRYKVQVYPAGQLANDPKSVEQLQLGGIDFAVTGTGTYATHIQELNLTALPYLIETYEQGWKLYDESKWVQAQFDKGPAKGFRFLATWEAGLRVITSKEPLRTPDDAKGKKIRTFPNEMMRWTLDAMGFSVQVMPITEVYLALQQGAVHAQENPIDTVYANKFSEVAPYITITNHVYNAIPMAISEKTWAKLSVADREAVTKAGREVAGWIRKEIVANEARQTKEMEAKGAKVSRPDLAPFRKLMQPVYTKAREKYGADLDTILADADAIRKAAPASAANAAK